MGNCCGTQSTADRRQNNWKATGIVSLRDAGIHTLPSSVLEISIGVKVLDVAGNSIAALPDAELPQFVQLQRLVLSNNALAHLSPGLGGLLALKYLALDCNRLSHLPPELGNLTRLETLLLQQNNLTSLPVSLGQLNLLKQLNISNNSITTLPTSLAHSTSLQELDASCNRLSSLPSSLGALVKLKVLQLDNNNISCVPGDVLLGCSSLHTLSLHGNPATAEALQETPGWSQYEARRRSKFDRIIAGNALLSSNGMDEGVDRLLK
eukprot:gene3118-3396_t